ncbi:MAG: oxidoreductase, partial [Chloroflexia bacterium]|nr:oxidoreductase [Chloroflexia bacterium]
MAALAFGAALWGWFGDPEPVDVAWAPEWGLRFAFQLDGLAALYALLATGVGLTTLVYAGGYVPRHLAHQGRSPAEAVRLYGLLLLFMGAMVGLVMAQDLILLFVFWDLTAVVSYLLIAYDRQEAESRSAALMAMLITGISAVLLLIGSLMLGARYGTFAIPEILAAIGGTNGDGYVTGAAAMIAVAGLAKSAQVPLHFWLPRAMAAPTPVSAYLHSAAMVAAGVFLLGRFYPILVAGDGVRDGLLVVGLASMGIGGV